MVCLSCSNHSSRKKSMAPAVTSQPKPVANVAAERASLAALAAALLLLLLPEMVVVVVLLLPLLV
jgi:hypothetical protein